MNEELREPGRTGADTDGHADIEFLTSDQASEYLSELGCARVPKTVRRLCKQEELTCKRIENNLKQMEWRIAKSSLDEFAQTQRTLSHVHGQPFAHVSVSEQENINADGDAHDRPLASMDSHVLEEKPSEVQADTDGHADEDGHVRVSENQSSELVGVYKKQIEQLNDQLNKKDAQIDRKDAQIEKINSSLDSLLERDRETNILIQNLQGMLTSSNQLGDGNHRDEPTEQVQATVIQDAEVIDENQTGIQDVIVESTEEGAHQN